MARFQFYNEKKLDTLIEIFCHIINLHSKDLHVNHLWVLQALLTF